MNQIEAGIEQFEWAIRLYLTENAYVPAITLAGASEGIFGEVKNGFIFNKVAQKVSSKHNQSIKSVKFEINKVRNWLKHGDNNSLINLTTNELQAVAISRIIISATTLIHLQSNYMSNLLIKFMQHTQNFHSDFLPQDGFDWNSINYLEDEK